MKKYICAFLSLALLAGLFAGCDSQQPGPSYIPTNQKGLRLKEQHNHYQPDYQLLQIPELRALSLPLQLPLLMPIICQFFS